MSDQNKTIPLPEPYFRQKLAALYRNLSIPDDTVKLLRKYLKAMSNLYGVIPLDKVYEIIDSQNPGLLTKGEFAEYIMVARHEREYFAVIGEADRYTGRQFETSLRRLLIDLYLLDKESHSLEKSEPCRQTNRTTFPKRISCSDITIRTTRNPRLRAKQ